MRLHTIGFLARRLTPSLQQKKTPELIRSLGTMVGRMHYVSQTLELPHWFTCPRYDIDWVTSKVEAALGTDMDSSAEELAKLSSLLSRFSQFVREQGDGRDVFWTDSLRSGTP